MRKSLLFALQPWPADGLKQKKSLEKDKIFFFDKHLLGMLVVVVWCVWQFAQTAANVLTASTAIDKQCRLLCVSDLM